MKKLLLLISATVLVGCAGQQAASPGPHAREVEGPHTLTTLVEDFDQGPSAVPLQYRVDHSGGRIASTGGVVEPVEQASPEGGTAVRFGFTASFDQPYAVGDPWKDSGVSFIARVAPGRPPANAEGIAIRLKPEGFTLMELYLVQEVCAGTRAYYLPLFVNEGQWKEWKIPFASFTPTDNAPPLDANQPIAIEAYIPFMENWNAFHFRGGTGAACALLVDDVGFWRSKEPASGGLLEGFDDERDRMPFALDLYGSSVWMDYARTEQGELKLNDGVRGQQLTLERRPDGTEGNALQLAGRLELDPAIANYHRAGNALAVFLKAPIGRPLGEARSLSFRVRSDVVRGGSLEVQDEENDRYYGSSFEVSGGWTRVVIPFFSLETEGGTLANAEKVTDRPRLQLVFELEPAAVERAAAKGALEFVIALDSLALEP